MYTYIYQCTNTPTNNHTITTPYIYYTNFILPFTHRTYSEQHLSIMEALNAFDTMISNHASDFIAREKLIMKGFCKYLLSVVGSDLQGTNIHMNNE